MKVHFVILLLLQVPFPAAYCTLRLNKFVCIVHDKSWLTVHTCLVKAQSRHINGLYFNATLLKRVTTAKLNYAFNRHVPIRVQHPYIINMTVDVCEFFQGHLYNPVASWVFKMLADFSNINHACPYEGVLTVKGFYIRENLLTQSLPAGRYDAVLAFYYHGKLGLTTELHFDVKK